MPLHFESDRIMNGKADIISDTDTGWILDPDLLNKIITFTNKNLNDNPISLKMKFTGKVPHEILDRALIQIDCRHRYSKKFPSFLINREFIFPSRLSAEQATDEKIAHFHSTLIPKDSSILDLTSGLGMDSMSFSKVSHVTACELDPLKAEILKHNTKSAGLNNIEILNTDSILFLNHNNISYDVIFGDPARRSTDNRRIYNPCNCLPDIIGASDLLLSRCNKLITKHSPLMDIHSALKIFRNIEAIYIISLRGECKEVLVVQNGQLQNSPTKCHTTLPHSISDSVNIICIDILTSGQTTEFHLKSHDLDNNRYDIDFITLSRLLPNLYMYEPNASVMKTGAWGGLCNKFPKLMKGDKDTHIFFSTLLYENFPGRILRVTGIPDRRDRMNLKGMRYNVVTRNYPIPAEKLAATLKVLPGDKQFIYGMKVDNKPLVLIAESII